MLPDNADRELEELTAWYPGPHIFTTRDFLASGCRRFRRTCRERGWRDPTVRKPSKRESVGENRIFFLIWDILKTNPTTLCSQIFFKHSVQLVSKSYFYISYSSVVSSSGIFRLPFSPFLPPCLPLSLIPLWTSPKLCEVKVNRTDWHSLRS